MVRRGWRGVIAILGIGIVDDPDLHRTVKPDILIGGQRVDAGILIIVHRVDGGNRQRAAKGIGGPNLIQHGWVAKTPKTAQVDT